MSKRKVNISLVVLLVIYLVGAIGHLFPYFRPLFLVLTPYNLIFTLLMFYILHSPIKMKIVRLSLIIFFIGLSVEIIGVKTGVLFGDYWYGSTLGFKIFEVPIIIGLNWVLLSLLANGIVTRFINNYLLSATVGAILMVLLDVLIEPIAVSLDYWKWETNEIPMQNYVMWFLTALVIQYMINKFKIRLNFKVSLSIFLVQLLFFAFLNVFL